MAEFNFFGTWKDSVHLVESLLALNLFRFFVDMSYRAEGLFEFNEFSKATGSILKKNSRFYLLPKEDPISQIRFFTYKNGVRRIELYESECLMSVLLCKEERGEIITLGNGEIYIPTHFVQSETKEWYYPPERLKIAYKKIQKIAQKDCKKRYSPYYVVTGNEITIKPILNWIASDGMELIEQGKAGIRRSEFAWFTKENLVKNKDDLKFGQ